MSADDDAFAAHLDSIDAWVAERERDFAEPIPEPPPVPTPADEARAALVVWLEASLWTDEEAAVLLCGLDPMRPDGCLPGLVPDGTIYGEGGEPEPKTLRESILRPEAYRQTEAGPCARRVQWRGQVEGAVRRMSALIAQARQDGELRSSRPANYLLWAEGAGMPPTWLDMARIAPELAALIEAAQTPEVFAERSDELPASVEKNNLKGQLSLYPQLPGAALFIEDELRVTSRPNAKNYEEIADMLRNIGVKRYIKKSGDVDISFPNGKTVEGWRTQYINAGGAVSFVRACFAVDPSLPDSLPDLPDVSAFRSRHRNSDIG